jgi:hypothetical protein
MQSAQELSRFGRFGRHRLAVKGAVMSLAAPAAAPVGTLATPTAAYAFTVTRSTSAQAQRATRA